MLNSTLSAVIGVPSCHTTMPRHLNVSMRRPSLISHDRASSDSGSSAGEKLIRPWQILRAAIRAGPCC